MAPKMLQRILDRLPNGEHEIAKQRIDIAERFGWRWIQLWDWGLGLSHMDLVGFKQGVEFDFLPELDAHDG